MNPKPRFRYPFLTATLALLALAFAGFALGLFAVSTVGLIVAAGQVALLSLSPRRAGCFATAITPEQLGEFEAVVKECRAGVARLNQRTLRMSPQAGVSEDCARFLGLMTLNVGVQRGQITGREADSLRGVFKEVLGKTAMTSSDIPLPTEYSGEVVELVSRYGAARRWGSVFPLGAGTVKLPRLKTDTTFTLIAGSGTVTEKSPQTEWVTFTAEKFGGLLRLPTELFEDSVIPLGQWIARYAARNIDRAEDANFFTSTGAGSGVNGSVEGFTTSTITNAKTLQMASTKTHYSDATLTNLRALRTVPDEPAVQEGAYYLNPTFEQLLASFNTAGDRPYNPNAQLADASGALDRAIGPERSEGLAVLEATAYLGTALAIAHLA